MTKKTNQEIQIAVIATDISYIKSEIQEMSKRLCESYVTKEEFDPIKKVVYGLIGLILTAVIGGLIALVVSPK